MSSEVLSKKPDDKTRPSKPLFRRPDMRNIQWYHLVLGAIAVAALIYFNMQTGGVFLSQRNLTLLLKQAAILGVVSAGMVVLIIARQIDLSAGMAVYLVRDRKSTRLNSSHVAISYAVFCVKKKNG